MRTFFGRLGFGQRIDSRFPNGPSDQLALLFTAQRKCKSVGFTGFCLFTGLGLVVGWDLVLVGASAIGLASAGHTARRGNHLLSTIIFALFLLGFSINLSIL